MTLTHRYAWVLVLCFIDTSLNSHDLPTQEVMLALQKLMGTVNLYLKEVVVPPMFLLNSVAVYIMEMFELFGLVPPGSGLSYGTDGDAPAAASKEAVLGPVLDVVSKFRDTGDSPSLMRVMTLRRLVPPYPSFLLLATHANPRIRSSICRESW